MGGRGEPTGSGDGGKVSGLDNTKYGRIFNIILIRISPPFPCLDGGRAGTGGRDFVYADSSKSARLK